MNESIVNEICLKSFNEYPSRIKFFEIGYGNYVYKICFGEETFVLRINNDKHAYKDTIYWLNRLQPLNLPIPAIIDNGKYNEFSYLVLSYIHGDDLGNIYLNLSDEEKRDIARNIVNIQNKVSTLPKNSGYGDLTSYNDKSYKKTWKEVILEHLNRSRLRIKENNIFDYRKVDSVEVLLENYNDYFNVIEPIPFLDDLSSKNVLIYCGKLSGIIDIDWMCFGDKLYYVALTNMALISLGYDTKYVEYIMNEMNSLEIERKILKLYTLVFCLDFMGEKGMKFKDKVIKVSTSQIKMLNEMYDNLYNEINHV